MITTKDIEKLAELARIHIEEGEKEALAKEIDSILAYVAALQDASKEAVTREDANRNVFREDANPHESAAFTESLLNAAPKRDGQYFKVKKILGSSH